MSEDTTLRGLDERGLEAATEAYREARRTWPNIVPSEAMRLAVTAYLAAASQEHEPEWELPNDEIANAVLGFTYDEADRELLSEALHTTLTWTLDALGARITTGSDLEPCFDVRRRILRIAEALGKSPDDSYRMGHLRKLAESHGRLDEWLPDGKTA